MTPAQCYELDSVDTKAILDSPEAFEIVIRGPLPCDCDEDAAKIVRPELPVRPIDRGMPGIELLCCIVIGKFLYHLPHYRQVTKTLKGRAARPKRHTSGNTSASTAATLRIRSSTSR